MTLPKRNSYALLTILVLSTAVLLSPKLSLADSGPISAIMSTIEAVLYIFVTTVFGWLAGMSGTILNYAVNQMVIGFGELYINKGLGFTIDGLWVMVRDIFNLTFIFGLVFIGLRLIFDSANTSARKTLVSLILAALLVNFSLFITKFIVDFSNIAAIQLVSAFPADTTTTDPNDVDVTGAFMHIMGGPSLFSKETLELKKTFDGFSGGAGLTYVIGVAITLLIMTFVFLGGALLLMIRFVALMFYMALSPLMFAGMVFPSAARVTQEFWSGFLGKAFFAPAYILMLYFSFKILSTFAVTGSGTLAAAFVGGPSGSRKAVIEDVLPPLILGGIFLIASLIIAQKMGATGASGVISAGKMLTGKVKRAAADRTIGVGARGAARLLNSDAVTRANARLNTMPGWTGKLARAGVAGASLGALSKRNRQAIISGSENLSIAGSQSLAARKKEDQNIANTDNLILKKAALEKAIQAGTDPNNVAQLATLRARRASLPPGGALSPTDQAALDALEKIETAMQKAINDSTTAMFEGMSDATLKSIAEHMSVNQVENFMKSDKVGEGTKGIVAQARYDAIEKVVGKTGSIITKELNKLTIDQIESMGEDWIRENVHLFSNSQMDELKKSKKFTPSQQANFKAERTGWHKAAKAGTDYRGKPTNIRDLFENNDGSGTYVGPRKGEDIANLDRDILLDPSISWFMTKEALAAIAKKGTLDAADRVALRTSLLAYPPGPNFAEINSYLTSGEGVKYFT